MPIGFMIATRERIVPISLRCFARGRVARLKFTAECGRSLCARYVGHFRNADKNNPDA